MSIFDYFVRKKQPSSAALAKERLQIIVTQQRSRRGQPDYLPMLERELLEVVRRYVNVDNDAINISLDSEDEYSVLELNVTLPRN